MKRAVEVMVRKQVEITREEARSLQEFSQAMYSLSRHQKRGWFLPWMQAHAGAYQVLRKIFERSHHS